MQFSFGKICLLFVSIYVLGCGIGMAFLNGELLVNRVAEAKPSFCIRKSFDEVRIDESTNNAIHGIETGWKFSKWGEELHLTQVASTCVALEYSAQQEEHVYDGKRRIASRFRTSSNELQYVLYSKTGTILEMSSESSGMIFTRGNNRKWTGKELDGYEYVGSGFSDIGTIGIWHTANSRTDRTYKGIWLANELVPRVVTAEFELPGPVSHFAIVGRWIVTWNRDLDAASDQGKLVVYDPKVMNESMSLTRVWEMQTPEDVFEKIRRSEIAVNEFGYLEGFIDSVTNATGLVAVVGQLPSATIPDVKWDVKLPNVEQILGIHYSPMGTSVSVVSKNSENVFVDLIRANPMQHSRRLKIKVNGHISRHQLGWISEEEFVVTWYDHVPEREGQDASCQRNMLFVQERTMGNLDFHK